MTDISDFRNTETITRFLRNKDTEVSDIYNFTTEKLFNKSDDFSINLPQKEKFILELIVDRISQSNKLSQKFIYSSQTWQLFNFIWDISKNDPKLSSTRSKILAKFKFGDIFTRLLKEIHNNELYNNVVLIENLIISLTYLAHHVRVHLSDEQNLTLVKYLLLLLNTSSLYSSETVHKILHLVCFIFKLNNSNTLSYDTKHKSEFARTCLANVIVAAHRYTNDSRLKQDLKNILYKVLLSEEDQKQTVSLVDQLTSVQPNNILREEEVLYLLKLVIPKVEVLQLETIVQTLIDFFPLYSTKLLSHVTEMNKTLSTEFLSSLVEKELQRDQDTSYELIIHCIKRNSDVTLKFSKDICRLCSKQNDHSLDLFKEVFDSYMKTREIGSFLTLWSELVDTYPNTVFDSDEMIDFSSLKISTLSYTQLSTLFESEVGQFLSHPTKTPVFLLSASKGMLKAVSGSIQNALSKTLIQNMYQLQPQFMQLLGIETEASWRLKFYILSLFDIEELGDDLSKLIAQRNIASDYYYFAILRVIEQDVTLSSPEFLHNLLTYFKESSSLTFRKTIFTRWFRLIETLFTNIEIKELVKLLVKHSSGEEVEEILQTVTLQAQPIITNEFVGNITASSSSLKYCECISVYALSKKQRVKILDVLLEKLDQVPNARETIINLLQLPSYKSKLETDYKTLLLLATRLDSGLDKIIRFVIANHFKQSAESASYLDGIFKFLSDKIKSLKLKSCGKYLHYLSVVSILIEESEKSSYEGDRETLVSVSVNKVMSLLSENADLTCEHVSVMINFLTDVNFKAKLFTFPDDTKEIVSKIGLKYLDNEELKSSLFGLICSLDQLYKPEYIFGLYVVLSQDANREYAARYVSTLAERETVFIESWLEICDSIRDSSNEDLGKYFDLATMFISHVKKPNDVTRVRIVQTLFIHTISHTFTKIVKIQSFGSICLLNCMKTVISSKIWLFTQYATELTFAFISHVSNILQNFVDYTDVTVKAVYCDLCQTISSVILYQRKRLSNRHHLITSVLTSLMKTLFLASPVLASEGGLVFERLVSNLCEPNVSNLHIKHGIESEKDAEASNALSQTKAGLRKYVPVLILNYIKFYLQYKVDVAVKPYLDNAVYMMLDLLTLNELNYVNKSLDNQGRVIFKTLYEDYKKFYKWNEE